MLVAVGFVDAIAAALTVALFSVTTTAFIPVLVVGTAVAAMTSRFGLRDKPGTALAITVVFVIGLAIAVAVLR